MLRAFTEKARVTNPAEACTPTTLKVGKIMLQGNFDKPILDLKKKFYSV